MIFFDIDDTLVTHSQSQKLAAQLFWAEFATRLPYTSQEFPAVWDAVMRKHFATFAAGQISFREHRLRRVREIFKGGDPPLLEEEADANFRVYLSYYEDQWTLFDDVLACLDALAGHRLGIISNGNAEQQKRKLHRLGIGDRFSTIVISEDLGVWKPNPEIFREACKQASEKPHDCLYVGDDFARDAQASLAAGLRGIWLNRNQLPVPKAGVSVISTLTELAAAF